MKKKTIAQNKIWQQSFYFRRSLILSSSSSRSTYSNPPPVSASSIARSLNAQGYRIGQIRKYLKENGYGDYRRKEIKEMVGK